MQIDSILSSAREAAAIFVLAANITIFVLAPALLLSVWICSILIPSENTEDTGPK